MSQQSLWRRAHRAYEEENGTADDGDLASIIGEEGNPNIEACEAVIADPHDDGFRTWPNGDTP